MLPVLFDQAQQLADYAREALARLGSQNGNLDAGRGARQNGLDSSPASLLKLSDAARDVEGQDAPALSGLDSVLGQAIGQLARDAVAAFEALGMDRGIAEQAAKALTDAVRGKTGGADFAAQLSSMTATQETAVSGDGFYYGASMTLQQVDLSYDEESGVFTATVVQVSISLEVASGSMINRIDPIVLDLEGIEQDLRAAQNGLFFDPESSLPARMEDKTSPLEDLASLFVIDKDDAEDDGSFPPKRLSLDAVLPLLLPRETVDQNTAPVDLKA